MKMKKILAVVVHLLSLGMVIVSIYILYAKKYTRRLDVTSVLNI